MSTTVTQTLAQPAPAKPRSAPAAERAGGGGAARGARTDTQATQSSSRPAPTLPGRAPAESSTGGAEKDRVTLQSSDPRAAARTVQETGANVTRLQSAGQQVDTSIRDLQRLGAIASQSATAPKTTDRTTLSSEAKAIGDRLAKADGNADVQAARAQVRQATLQRNANDARSEATRRGREATEARQAEAKSQPPTLVLEPRQPDAEQAQRRADRARADARDADEAVQAGRRDARTAKEAAAEQRAATSLRPEQTDVSTPEQAQKTLRSANDAEKRATEFRAGITRAESEAGDRARQAVQGTATPATQGTGRPTGTAGTAATPPRLRSEAEGQQTAERVRQAAQRNPEAFVASQARVAADAAARLLA